LTGQNQALVRVAGQAGQGGCRQPVGFSPASLRLCFTGCGCQSAGLTGLGRRLDSDGSSLSCFGGGLSGSHLSLSRGPGSHDLSLGSNYGLILTGLGGSLGAFNFGLVGSGRSQGCVSPQRRLLGLIPGIS
jgi:hypothetical protein